MWNYLELVLTVIDSNVQTKVANGDTEGKTACRYFCTKPPVIDAFEMLAGASNCSFTPVAIN